MANSNDINQYTANLRAQAAKRIAQNTRFRPRQSAQRRGMDIGAISRSVSSYRETAPAAPPKPDNPFKSALENVLNWEPLKFTLKALDTPGSYVRGAAAELINPTEKSVLGSASENTRNLWNDEKTLYTQDILKENRERNSGKPDGEKQGGEKIADFTVGLAGDILMDPLSYLGVGLISKGVNAGKKAAGIETSAEQLGRAARHGTPRAPQRLADSFRQSFKEADSIADLGRGTVNNYRRSRPVDDRGRPVVSEPTAPTGATTQVGQEIDLPTKYDNFDSFVAALRQPLDVEDVSDAAAAARVAPEGRVTSVLAEPQQQIAATSAARGGNELVPAFEPKELVPFRSQIADDIQPSPKTIQKIMDPRPPGFTIESAFKKVAPTKAAKDTAPTPSAPQVLKTEEALKVIAAPQRGTPAWSRSYEDWYTNPSALKQVGGTTALFKGPGNTPTQVSVRNMLRYFQGDLTREQLADLHGVVKTRESLDALDIFSAKATAAFFDEKILKPKVDAANKKGAAAQAPKVETAPSRPEPAPLPASPEEAARWTDALGRKKAPAGYVVLTRREWDKARKKLERQVKRGWIEPKHFEALKAARNNMDPKAWDDVVRNIMYEGQPSPIQPALREISETRTTPEILKESTEETAEAMSVARETLDNADANVTPVEEVTSAAQVKADNVLMQLSEADRAAALNIMQKVSFREWGQLAKYTKPTRIKGTKVWSEKQLGRNRYGFNTFSQYTLFKNTINELLGPLFRSKDVKQAFYDKADELVQAGRLDEKAFGHGDWGLQGYVREETVMPVLRAQIDYMKNLGIIPSLGTGASGKPLSIVDIIDSLPRGRGARDMFFHPSSNVAITNVEDTVDYLMDRATTFYKEFIKDKGVMPTSKDWKRFQFEIIGNKSYKLDPNETILNDLRTHMMKSPGYKGAGKNQIMELSPAYIAFLNKTRKTNKPGAEWSKILVDAHIRTLVANTDVMFEKMMLNAAKYNGDIFAQTNAISAEFVERFGEAITSPNGTFTGAFAAVKGADEFIEETGEALGAHNEALLRASEKTDEWIDSTIDPRLKEEIDNAEAAVMAARQVDNAEEATEAVKTQVKTQFDEGARQFDDDKLPAPDVYDAATTQRVMHDLERRFGRALEAFAKNTYGMPTIGNAITRFRNVLRPQRAYYHNAVAGAYKKFGKDTFDETFFALQRGVPIDTEASREIRPLVDYFFNTEGGALSNEALSAWVRNGFDFELINAHYAAQGLEDIGFSLEKAEALVKAGEFDDIAQALGAQWRDWNIKDPAEFLKISENVINHQVTLQATVYQGIRYAEQTGQIRHKPTPGFVKYVNSSPGAVVPKYLPKDVYIARDIAPEFAQMDKVLGQSLMPNSAFGRFVRGPLGTIMAMWKSGMTIWNPRHYFRNGVGDISLNFLAGVSDPRAYKDAMKMMAARGDYGYWEGLEALKAAGEVIKKPGEPLFFVGSKGKKNIPVTAEELYKNLRARGVLNSFPVRENLFDDMVDREALERMQERIAITGGRLKERVVKTHEWRDHFIRSAHAIDVMKKGNFKSLDEALEAAAREVRKWHPDGSDMSNWQNKYMRTVFPFYSWTRGAIPLVVESMLTRPGRYAAYPRAYQNAAMAMGVEMDSIADPFPIDQLFPDFMTDKMTGPLFRNEHDNYIGIHPGVVQDDLSGFANDPFRAALGMLSPAIKAPIEAVSGQNLGINAPISDTSDYVDSQLPGINVLSNLTGKSVSGSFWNTLTFNRTYNEQTGEETILDPQRSVQRGVNEPGLDWTNWLLGLQAQNMSQSNYINLAEIQERDRAAKRAREADNG